MVAQVDEQHTAMVANAMAPAGQADRLADMAVAERAAGVGPVTMHGIPKNQMSEDRIEGQKPPRRASGFTRGCQARQPNARPVLAAKTDRVAGK
jgi:hypothetical protein